VCLWWKIGECWTGLPPKFERERQIKITCVYMVGGDGDNDGTTGEYHWEVESGSLSRNGLLKHLFQHALLANLANRDNYFQLSCPAM
jgi:hypothetical protein